jgi:hypothetical protein
MLNIALTRMLCFDEYPCLSHLFKFFKYTVSSNHFGGCDYADNSGFFMGCVVFRSTDCDDNFSVYSI